MRAIGQQTERRGSRDRGLPHGPDEATGSLSAVWRTGSVVGSSRFDALFAAAGWWWWANGVRACTPDRRSIWRGTQFASGGIYIRTEDFFNFSIFQFFQKISRFQDFFSISRSRSLSGSPRLGVPTALARDGEGRWTVRAGVGYEIEKRVPFSKLLRVLLRFRRFRVKIQKKRKI